MFVRIGTLVFGSITGASSWLPAEWCRQRPWPGLPAMGSCLMPAVIRPGHRPATKMTTGIAMRVVPEGWLGASIWQKNALLTGAYQLLCDVEWGFIRTMIARLGRVANLRMFGGEEKGCYQQLRKPRWIVDWLNSSKLEGTSTLTAKRANSSFKSGIPENNV